MSSNGIFLIRDYEFAYTRNHLDPILMTLFRASDRTTWTEHYNDAGVDVVDVHHGYKSTAGRVLDRLGLMGFTLRASRLSFERDLPLQIGRREEYAGCYVDGGVPGAIGEQISALRALTFEGWQELFRSLLDAHATPWCQEARSPLSALQRYAIDDNADHLLAFGYGDERLLLAGGLAACDGDAPVVYDLTDLIDGGYFDPDDDFVELAYEQLRADIPVSQRVVILTEGSSDADLLRRSLELLCPHLADYYSFFDFEASNSRGGAGPLVQAVKAFAAAGIVNRTIALLDNDTAAHVALRGLRKTSLPENIVVRNYPAIPLLSSYPTLGPNGELALDVNGRAGSLELYFGIDVLRREDGSLTPVHWRGYDEAVSAYQGEVLDKASLQEMFRAKLKAASHDRRLLESLDWTGVMAILATIRGAFADR